MKRKIRIKKLPKAQYAGQTNLTGQTLNPGNTAMSNYEWQMKRQNEMFKQQPLTLEKPKEYNDFDKEVFFNNPNIPQIGANKFDINIPQVSETASPFDDIRNQQQTLSEGETQTNVAPNIQQLQKIDSKPLSPSNVVTVPLVPDNGGDPTDLFGAVNSTVQDIGMGMLTGIKAVEGFANTLERKRAEDKMQNRFLSDAMYSSLPSDYSGNRGDYTLNQGLGNNFRPNETVYGQFGKVAQYGGQMKRKIKITGLPQQAYGGTQNRSSIDEMYPTNSNVRRAQYSNLLKGNPDNQVKQYIQQVPREIANIEAERGETIVKPNDSGLLNMFKIGGKRHSEGGTPLQANSSDFIFSDTKDMRIKDPQILESFGMKLQKKGRKGYTPAEISKNFNLNDPQIQKALNDPKADYIEKATAERLYDNNLSQLGKLALIQEGRKGFPQGTPDIALPYMQKVGMDPSMFMPDVMTPQDAVFEMGKAQVGQQVGQPINWMAPVPKDDYSQFSWAQPQTSQPAQQQMPQVNQQPASTTTPTQSVPQPQVINPSSIYGSDSFITKYGKGTNGKVRVMLDPNASYEDKVRTAEEATALKFGTGTKAPIQQGKTPGYEYFYAGLTPSDFEKRYLQGFMDMDKVEAMTPLERRKALFGELGIEATEDQLNDPKSLYNNKDWLKNTFYTAFKSKLPRDQFREIMGDDFMFGLEHFDNIPKRKTPTPGPTPGPTPEPDPGPTPGKIKKDEEIIQADPGKYYLQDKMNLALAANDRLGIKKYIPYDASVPAPALMDPTFYDPSRELAATSEMSNIVTQNLGQFSDPRAFGARASQVQGNAAKNVADILGRYNNLNVGVANQFEQANKQLINDFNVKRAIAKGNYYDKNVIANQQFDNAKRAANARLMQQATNAVTNKAKTQVLNSLFPEYAIDPTTGGEMMFIPSQRTIDGSSANNQMQSKDISSMRQQYKQMFPNLTDNEIDKELLKRMSGSGRQSSSGSASRMADFLNFYKNSR